MMHKQIVRLLAVFLTATLVATACGGSSGDETAPATTAAAADDATDNEPDDDAASPSASTEPPLEDENQITSEGEGMNGLDLDPVAGGEITFALVNDGTGFSTTDAIAPGSIRVITSMNDSIAGLNDRGEWIPNLAESITPNDDFTEWIITMREGLLFADGEPVDGEAVRANIQAFKDGSVTGFAFTAVESIDVVDDLSVKVTMNTPWGAFPFQLVGQPGWMVSPSTIGQNDTFMGTGPFMLESWVPGDSVRVVRNPNYWRADEGLPYLDAITFKFLPDQTVRRQALEAGDIEGYISPGDSDIVDFLEDDNVNVWLGEAGANEYLYLLNTTKAPFDDIRVRRALAHATDRDFLIENFRSGLTTPANGPINPSSKWWVDTDYPEYDLEAAKALVDEYEAEVGPIEFEISIEPSPATEEVLDVAISFWQEAGMDASAKLIGGGQSAATAIADDFQAFSWFQFGSPDPDGVFTFMHSSSGFLNWSNLQNDKIDEGLRIGRENVDEATRKEGYALFQEGLTEALPFIWIDHLNGIEGAAVMPRLHGIGANAPLVNGDRSLGMTNGSFFSWEQVWLEP